jgi:hypothetical protein
VRPDYEPYTFVAGCFELRYYFFPGSKQTFTNPGSDDEYEITGIMLCDDPEDWDGQFDEYVIGDDIPVGKLKAVLGDDWHEYFVDMIKAAHGRV